MAYLGHIDMTKSFEIILRHDNMSILFSIYKDS